MCNWCGCAQKPSGFGGRKMADGSGRHERTESQKDQIFEYGKVRNKSAPKDDAA